MINPYLFTIRSETKYDGRDRDTVTYYFTATFTHKCVVIIDI